MKVILFFVDYILPFVLFLAIVSFFVGRKRAEVLSHWQHFFDQVHFSAQDIYNEILRKIDERDMPNIVYEFLEYWERGIIGGTRRFLRLESGPYVIDVCCAEYGTGYYISWWLCKKEPNLTSRIPILNTLLGTNLKRQTYHQQDSANMFKSLTHKIVLGVVENLTKENGLRALSEREQESIDKHRFLLRY